MAADEAEAAAAEATAEIIRRSGYEVKIHDKVNVVSVLIEGIYYYADIQPIDKYGPDCKVKYRYPAYLEIIGTSDSIKIFKQTLRIYDKIYDKLNYEIHPGRLYNNRYLNHHNSWARFDDKNVWSQFNYGNFIDIIDQDFMPVKAVEVNIKNEGSKFVLNGRICQNDFNITIFSTAIDKMLIVEGKYSESGRDDLFKYLDERGELYTMLLDTKTNEITLNSATQIIKLTHFYKCVVYPEDGLYNGYLVNRKKLKSYYVFYYNYTFFAYYDKESKYIELEARMVNSGLNTKPAIAAATE